MRKSARNMFLIPRAVRFVCSHAMLVVMALVITTGVLLAANLCGMIMPFFVFTGLVLVCTFVMVRISGLCTPACFSVVCYLSGV